MPERIFRLVLTSSQLLELLAEVVQAERVAHLADLQVNIATFALATEATLFVPDPDLQRQSERRALFADVLDKAHTLFGCSPTPVSQVNSVSSLVDGLIQALENSSAGDAHVKAEEVDFLVVAQGVDVSRAAAICSDLRFHATATRFATARAQSDETSSENCFLFHVQADRARRSSFHSALAGDFFDDCAVLAGYRSGESLIFLHPDAAPSATGLRHFRRLAQSAPALFGGSSGQADHNLLLAAYLRPQTATGEKPNAVWYLRHLPFQSCVDLEPRQATEQISFSVVKLEVSEGLKTTLRVRIEEAARRPEEYIGYRLELRRTHLQEWDDTEYERLQAAMLKLDYELAYMDSIQRPRPHLLRFSQRQLPALADLLRSYPVKTLQRGELLYGFRADDDQRDGAHFVFVPPNVVRSEADPLERWTDLDDQPMKFWIDPFWGRHYHAAPNQSLVFVPHGTTLFPSMHAWEVDEMDEYLRQILGRWFHGQRGIAAIPAQPIYVFDGAAQANAPIHISVLNYADFQPLVTQLAWLNDNLTFLDAQDATPQVRSIAADENRRRLAERVNQQAADAESHLARVTAEVQLRVAAQTQALAHTVGEQIADLLAETEKTAAMLQQLNGRLERLRALHSEMTALAESADRTIEYTDDEVKSTEVNTSTLQRRAQDAIQRADTTRAEIEAGVGMQIEALRRTRDRLRDRLNRL